MRVIFVAFASQVWKEIDSFLRKSIYVQLFNIFIQILNFNLISANFSKQNAYGKAMDSVKLTRSSDESVVVLKRAAI
jgi:hypothetical protein